MPFRSGTCTLYWILDMRLVGFIFGHGNSPSDNSAGRQHSLLSPLDCLSAKAGGAVNGGAFAPFILTVDSSSWLRYLLWAIVSLSLRRALCVL